jgi:hypothetical protein
MVLFDKHKLRSSRIVRVFASDPLLAALRFGWITLILWSELGRFFYTLLVCRWPKLHNRVRKRSTLASPLIVDYSSDEAQRFGNRSNTHSFDCRSPDPQPTRILSDTFRTVSRRLHASSLAYHTLPPSTLGFLPWGYAQEREVYRV